MELKIIKIINLISTNKFFTNTPTLIAFLATSNKSKISKFFSVMWIECFIHWPKRLLKYTNTSKIVRTPFYFY